MLKMTALSLGPLLLYVLVLGRPRLFDFYLYVLWFEGYHKRSSLTLLGIVLAHVFIYHFLIWVFKVASKRWKSRVL